MITRPRGRLGYRAKEIQIHRDQIGKSSFSSKASSSSTDDDVEIRRQWNVPSQVVAVPLHQRPLFPGVAIQLQLSPKLFNAVWTASLQIDGGHGLNLGLFLIVGQQNVSPSLSASWFLDVPHQHDLYSVGTLAKVVSINRHREVVLTGIKRIRLQGIHDPSLLTVDVDPFLPTRDEQSFLATSLVRDRILHLMATKAAQNGPYSDQLNMLIDTEKDRSLDQLLDQFIGLSTDLSVQQEQRLLSDPDAVTRAGFLFSIYDC
jgi:Lon protease-like protein